MEIGRSETELLSRIVYLSEHKKSAGSCNFDAFKSVFIGLIYIYIYIYMVPCEHHVNTRPTLAAKQLVVAGAGEECMEIGWSETELLSRIVYFLRRKKQCRQLQF